MEQAHQVPFREGTLAQIERIRRLPFSEENFQSLRKSLLSYISMKEVDDAKIDLLGKQGAMLAFEIEQKKRLISFYRDLTFPLRVDDDDSTVNGLLLARQEMFALASTVTT